MPRRTHVTLIVQKQRINKKLQAWIEDLDTTDIILWAKKLSDKDKEILTYLVVEKLQKQEIAVILECSPSAISKHLNRMREELREILPQA